jgi:hypothetical protein
VQTLAVTYEGVTEEIVVAGRKVPDRTWAFAELQMLIDDPQEFAVLRAHKRTLDLTVVGIEEER